MLFRMFAAVLLTVSFTNTMLLHHHTVTPKEIAEHRPFWDATWMSKTVHFNLVYDSGKTSLLLTFFPGCKEFDKDTMEVISGPAPILYYNHTFNSIPVTLVGSPQDTLFYSYEDGGIINKKALDVARRPVAPAPELTEDYLLADPCIIADTEKETQPRVMNIEDLAELLANKKVLFYTGAGISVAGGVFGMEDLQASLSLNPANPTEFITKALTQPTLILEPFKTFCKTAFENAPTPAHSALSNIASLTNTAIVTENFDLLHERAGTRAIRVNAHQFRADNSLKQIDALICLGLSHDDRGLIAWYKQKNPSGQLIALDLKRPRYIGNQDFLLMGDLQKTVPALYLVVQRKKALSSQLGSGA